MGNNKDKIRKSGLYPEKHLDKIVEDLNALKEDIKKRQKEEKEELKKEIKSMRITNDEYLLLLKKLKIE